MLSSNPAMTYLVWTALFTALMWVPYVLNRMMVWGLVGTVSYPENPPALAAWAERARRAHYNAVENLVVFAALVLAANAMGAASEVVGTAALVYFWARVAHWVVYVAAIPWARTLAFVAGWAAQVYIAVQILV